MAGATLTFETPQLLLSLLGEDIRQLRTVADACGVEITSRDSWVKIEGGKEAVKRASQVFEELESVFRKGGEVSPEMVRMVAQNGETDERPGERAAGLRLLGSGRSRAVLAKTEGQIAYVEAMQQHEVVFGIGPAGTGKTYLAMAQGLHLLKQKQVERLVLTRPAVEAGEALGFLPGDLKEKIFPYLRPLYDALYEMLDPDEAERLIEKNRVEIAPLAYMRGRTLKNAFIILDEAQNTTTEQMLMFLTRLGEGARCAVTGDPSQVDLRRGMRSGLKEAVEVLQGVEGVAFIRFAPKDIVRLPVVQRIIDAYDVHRSEREKQRQEVKEEKRRREQSQPTEFRPGDFPSGSAS